MPWEREFMPWEREFMPWEREFMPWKREFMPWEREFMPWKREFMPWEREFMPWKREFMPWEREFMPWEREFMPWERGSPPFYKNTFMGRHRFAGTVFCRYTTRIGKTVSPFFLTFVNATDNSSPQPAQRDLQHFSLLPHQEETSRQPSHILTSHP